MFEKVSPNHPDKIADRIAGAIVDLAYTKDSFPKVAVEVLIGHGVCHIINETSVVNTVDEIESIVHRIAGNDMIVDYKEVPQDAELAHNQENHIKCGDNGIFRGVPMNLEQVELYDISKALYDKFKSDGKYILNDNELIVCQSNATDDEIHTVIIDAEPDKEYFGVVNPLGYWTGGTDVDTGATNRKLGSDMGDSVTGGGLCGKDLSKADVSINIYAWLKAQQTGDKIELYCAIGDEYIDGKPYEEIVDIARKFIDSIGGFEKFAEWGLIRRYEH